MKKFLAVAVAAASLAACSKDDGASTAQTPEFYVYADKPVCLTEFANSEPDATKRREGTLDMLQQAAMLSRGGAQRFNIINVDYTEFKGFNLIVYAPCSDETQVKGTLAEISAVNKVFSGKVGGDAKLVGDAKVVTDFQGGVRRFEHFNPGVSAEVCLLRYSMPGAGDSADRIAQAIARTAVEYKFPISDFATEGETLYFLLSSRCDQKDKIAENMAIAFKRRGIEVGKLIVREAEVDYAGYLRMMPPSNEEQAAQKP